MADRAQGDGAESGRRCPRCATRLVDFDAEPDLNVDYCSQCKGLWCDADELEALVGEPLDPTIVPMPFFPAPGAGLACPGCGSELAGRTTLGDNPVELLDCGRCGGTWLDGGGLDRLRRDLRRHRVAQRAAMPRPPAAKELAPTVVESTETELPGGGATALPVAFVLALILSQPIFFPIFRFWVEMWVHELGHTIAFWLSGIFAMPVILVAQTWPSGDRSLLVVLVVTTALASLGWAAYRQKNIFVVWVAAGLLAVQAFLTLGLDQDRAEMWCVFAGLGGELILTAVPIVGFFHRAPKALRWDFWRYIVLVPATVVFVNNAGFWLFDAKPNPRSLPMGAAMGPQHGGDLNRMVADWGWTYESIVQSYRGLAIVCCAVIVGHWTWSVIRAARSWRAEAPVG